jgi:hypothetical protein
VPCPAPPRQYAALQHQQPHPARLARNPRMARQSQRSQSSTHERTIQNAQRPRDSQCERRGKQGPAGAPRANGLLYLAEAVEALAHAIGHLAAKQP